MLPFPLVYSLASAALAPLLFGYHMGELNAPEAVIRCQSADDIDMSGIDISLPTCIRMSTSNYGLVSSIFAFGGLIGALAGGPMGNKFGRRGSLLLCSVGFGLGGMVMAVAPSVFVLALGRTISGLASGAAVVVAPLYVHDLAPVDSKGSYGALTQISVNVGILLTQTLGLFLSKESLWRLILAVGGIIGIVQFFLLLSAQESPKWLAGAGRRDDAEDALQAIRGGTLSNVDIEDELREEPAPDAEAEPLLDEERGRDTDSDSNEKITLSQFLTLPNYRRPLIAVVGIMLVQQLTGINAIIMYGVSVLRDLIPGPNGAPLINVFISATNLFVTWYASRSFDSRGRIPFLLTSLTGLGINSALLGLGIIFHIPILSAIATILFVTSFSIGLGPIPWMVAAETVPFRAAGAAQSISLAANWIGTFIVSYGFPVLASSALGKGGVFLIFTGIAAASAVFVVECIPETRGLSVDQAWKQHEHGSVGANGDGKAQGAWARIVAALRGFASSEEPTRVRRRED